MKTTKLRPHHIFCERFLPLDDLGRGDAFARAIRNMKEMLESEDRVLIEVTEGIDDLCQDCPDRAGDRCENANGNEEKVRKWDSRIAAGLGIAYGERRSAAEFRDLILAKAPLDFCRERCPWKMFCSVFGIP
jgi:hypothetical protein